jgi:hypothetical protein
MSESRIHNRITSRLALYEEEVARLPARSCGIRVREGLAWVTASGEDQIVGEGETLYFAPGKFPAVVMALGSIQLILEVFGCDRPQLSHVKSSPMATHTARMPV